MILVTFVCKSCDFRDFFTQKYSFWRVFQTRHQYGGCYSFEEYFQKPKLFLSKIKNLILGFLKASKFSNNYFG